MQDTKNNKFKGVKILKLKVKENDKEMKQNFKEIA